MLFAAANAQTEKGSVIISGTTNLGFNNEKVTYKAGSITEEAPKINTFSITPSFGYFVADDFALGIDVNAFISTKTEEFAGSNYVTKTTRFTAMPTFTYFFHNESSFIPYLRAGVGYGTNKEKESYLGNSKNYDYDGFAWKTKAGVQFFVTKSIAFDLGLGYGKFHGKRDYQGKEMTITHKNLGANVGISVFLKKNKKTTKQ